MMPSQMCVTKMNRLTVRREKDAQTSRQIQSDRPVRKRLQVKTQVADDQEQDNRYRTRWRLDRKRTA